MKAYKTIDEYISQFPKVVQEKLNTLRIAIKEELPKETLEKISYGIPTFYLNGNLVHFAAFKDHLSFFPTGSAVEEFKHELQEYITSKGTIQIPLSEELPIGLIKKITKFRVSENATK